MWTLKQKNLWPHGSQGGPKVPRTQFFAQILFNKVPLSLPHAQNKFLGQNMDLFSNLEPSFEAELMSPLVKGEPVLNVLHLNITHNKDWSGPETSIGYGKIFDHCAMQCLELCNFLKWKVVVSPKTCHPQRVIGEIAFLQSLKITSTWEQLGSGYLDPSS